MKVLRYFLALRPCLVLSVGAVTEGNEPLIRWQNWTERKRDEGSEAGRRDRGETYNNMTLESDIILVHFLQE